MLLRKARANGCDAVVMDPLKDAIVGLTDDQVAAAYNCARQTALTAGVQIVELHHTVNHVHGANRTRERSFGLYTPLNARRNGWPVAWMHTIRSVFL